MQCPLLRRVDVALRDLPCSSVGGLHCPGPVNARIITWENVCSDRILTCRIKSIRSPAKVGLVVTDLITSPVVSWEGWETPPPSTAALLSFFAQPPAWEDLSLLW